MKISREFITACENDFIATILNLSHKLGISPFHISLNHKGNEICYSVKSKRWNRYLSFAISIIAAFFTCVSTSSAISRASIRSPSIIFMIAPDIGDNFLCFMLWYILWTRQKDIAFYFSLLSLRTQEKWRKPRPSSTFIFHGENKRKYSASKFIMKFLCISMVLLIVSFDMIKIFNRVSEPDTSFRHTFLGVFYQEMRRGLWLGEQPGKKFADMSRLEVSFAALYLDFTMYFKFVKAFAILLCLAGELVAFKNAWELRVFLEEEMNYSKVMQGFQAFQEFLEAINQIIGPVMFAIGIVCAPTFFVANMINVLLVWNLNSFAVWMTMGLYSAIIMIAAEIPSQTDEIREWMLERGNGQNEDKLFAVFVEITQNPLGVQGMECFTVTNKFMAQLFSAVVTFTIILLQFSGDQST